ncbi:MAG: DUF3318 domain-containing protein [Prochlorothrix sp.]|nr:DUF3318 domain-containing protein [Prochlorothrix sp.]
MSQSPFPPVPPSTPPPSDRATIDTELSRLLNLVPASGRHKTKLSINNQQPQVLMVPQPRPWHRQHRLTLNFTLWQQLSQPQQDLLLLRSVAWIMTVRWLKPEPYQGLIAIGMLGIGVEFLQADFVGLTTGLGLTALGGVQLWRRNHSPDRDLEADAGALRLAQRRGYPEQQAIEGLVSALDTVAHLEHRHLSLMELVRGQTLRQRLNVPNSPHPPAPRDVAPPYPQ